MKLALAILCAFASAACFAQDVPIPGTPITVGGQFNTIFQYHPEFPALYSGPNSMKRTPEAAASYVATFMTNTKLGPHFDFELDIEMTGGKALSTGFGLAGYTNLDIVRNPSLSKMPYRARYYLRYHDTRWTVLAGKFALSDFFDKNSVLSDSHFQFMNWTVCNNGAWDYASDLRGYTIGAMVEYRAKPFTVRFAEMMMPTYANGPILEHDLGSARGENLELEFHPEKKTTVRLLGYVNHADMGLYSTAGTNILSTERQGRTKEGVGVNVERPLTSRLALGGRWGWNDDRTESFAYTEVGNTVSAGLGYRFFKADKAGVAFVSNGISSEHAAYLARGGMGFLLGDGSLLYGREDIVESYYTHMLTKHLSAGPDFQHINNPGYNKARGAISVFGFRIHAEF